MQVTLVFRWKRKDILFFPHSLEGIDGKRRLHVRTKSFEIQKDVHA